MKEKEKKEFFYALFLGIQLGFLLALPLIFFLFLGIFFDKKFKSSPLFLISFMLFALLFLTLELKYYLKPFFKK